MREDDTIMICPDQASWRGQVLQGMLWSFTGIGVPTVIYLLVTSSRGLTRPGTLASIALTALLVLVTISRRWPLAHRAMVFIGVVYTGGVISILYVGFTLGTGLLMLLVVVTSGLFFGKGPLLVGLLVTGASLMGLGFLYTTDVLTIQRPDLLDFSQGINVIRVTMVYVVFTGMIAVSVSYIIERIERSLRQTSEALAMYGAEHRSRTAAEAALQRSEETYRDLVENINDVIYATDEHGVLTYLSPAIEAHSGYTPSELIGRSVFECVDKADRDQLRHALETTLAGQLEPSEFRIITKSGQRRWIRSSSRPMYDGDRVAGLRGVYIDITEQRQLEEKLRQTYKMEAIGTLAGGMAHEFNNILGIITGYTELTQYEMSRDSEPWANLQKVLQAGSRAKDLIQHILDFSRQSYPTRTPLSLSKVTQDVLGLLRGSLPATIDIRLHLNAAQDTILANQTQLHQVLLNLCTNAEYAMREVGGVLEIGIDNVMIAETDAMSPADINPESVAGSWVRLTVRDTGGGIPADIVDRIFDPFFTTKGIGEGTGMGLAIVHGIVTGHGGTITLQNVPGEGATFTLTFPQIANPVAVESVEMLSVYKATTC